VTTPTRTLLLKCVDGAEAKRLAEAVEILRAARRMGADERLQIGTTTSRLQGDHLKIDLDEYLPPELLKVLDDIHATALPALRASERIVAIEKAFLNAFRDAKIITIEFDVNLGTHAQCRTVAVSVKTSNWERTRDGLMRAHERMLVEFKRIDSTIAKETFAVVHVTGNAKEIHALRNGDAIKLTPSQKRTLAILALFPKGLTNKTFCDLYYESPLVEPLAGYFDTPVRALKKALPTLYWEADMGNRIVHGVVLRCAVSPRQLKQFLKKPHGKKGRQT